MAASPTRRRGPSKRVMWGALNALAQGWARRRTAVNPFELSRQLHPDSVTSGAPKIAQDASIKVALDWANSDWGGGEWAGIGLYGEHFLGYPILSALAQRPEYRRISEVVASEMTREWIEIKSTGDTDKTDKIKQLDDAQKRCKLQETFRKIAEQDGFFGRAHLYIDTGDDDDLEALKLPIGNGRNELSKAKVTKGKLRGFRPIEAVWCYPRRYNSTNPLKGDWYKPDTWGVMGGNEIHHTRLLTFVAREVPDLLKPAYSFGGLSLTQMAKSYVDKFIKDANSVSKLVEAFSVMVLKTNLGTGLQMGGDSLQDRLEFFVQARDNRGLMVLDTSTGEELTNVSAPLGSLDRLQAQSQEHICSITGLPLIKYTGLTPTGLNASSEGEIRSFYDWIKSCQEYFFREHLTAVLGFIQLNEFGEVDPEITFDFRSLWQLDDAAKAAIQKTKADTHVALVDVGAVTPEEVRQSQAADPDSLYAGLDLDAEQAPGLVGFSDETDDPSDPLTERVDRIAEGEGGVTSGV